MIRIDRGALAIINELITVDVLCCSNLCYSRNHKQFFLVNGKMLFISYFYDKWRNIFLWRSCVITTREVKYLNSQADFIYLDIGILYFKGSVPMTCWYWHTAFKLYFLPSLISCSDKPWKMNLNQLLGQADGVCS